MNRKNHWDQIYATKQLNQVSWFQPTPQTSLEFILAQKPAKNAAIIDIGGGDSFLVDNLLELGFTDISVLDISAKAISRAQERLAEKASLVNWIVSDILEFHPQKQFDIWHDRAAFHFLTVDHEVKKYAQIAAEYIVPNGNLLIGTFSNEGPTKCSGIEIKQYSGESMNKVFAENFNKTSDQIFQHPTPFDTVQEFIFCAFCKK